jgi:DNA-directed RNA polymerase specialized sigma24 family protein
LALWRLYSGEMKTTDSQSLLAAYAQTGSEPAFRELVTRSMDLVYSAAVRLVGNDADLAKDATQTVFIDLLRL